MAKEHRKKMAERHLPAEMLVGQECHSPARSYEELLDAKTWSTPSGEVANPAQKQSGAKGNAIQHSEDYEPNLHSSNI
jgi:hypothetical protein